MIFHRGRASHLYGTKRDIRESQRKPRERSGSLEDDSDGFGEFLGPEGTSIKEVQKLLKPWQCHRATPSRVESTLNIIFQLWQPSSNSAKSPRPVLSWLCTQSRG